MTGRLIYDNGQAGGGGRKKETKFKGIEKFNLDGCQLCSFPERSTNFFTLPGMKKAK